MKQARVLFRFDDEEKYYTAHEIMLKLGKITSLVYDTRVKERIIEGHKIKLAAKMVYDFYVDGKLIKEGVEGGSIGDTLEDIGYNRNYTTTRTAAKKTTDGIIIKSRWLYYDGKKRSEKVQSTLL